MNKVARIRTLRFAAIASLIFGLITAGHLIKACTALAILSGNDKIALMFAKTKSVCVGRFLIDVPATAEVVYGPAHIGGEITRIPNKGEEIASRVTARLAEIEEQKYLAERDRFGPDSLYGKTIAGQMPGQILVFGRADGVSYRVDSYIRVGNDLYIQEAYPFLEKASYSAAIDNLNSVATRLQERRDAIVPSAPGLCIDGAFVVDVGRQEFEWVTAGVRFKEFDDVHFSVSMAKKDEFIEADALEPRLQQAQQDASRTGHGGWYSRIRILREGERQIGKWKGVEALARKPALDDAEESHEFAFVSHGEPKNPLLPVLDVKLDSGVLGNKAGARKPSITDEEAVAIWDRITNSIRVRAVEVGSQGLD